MTVQRIVSVDPGRDKCGVAVLDRSQGILHREIVPTVNLAPLIGILLEKYDCRRLVLGNQTFSRTVREQLLPLLDQGRIDEIVMVDEHDSSEEARFRYWKTIPPTGWRRLVPLGLLIPPCAIDDFAAIILGERYFKKNGEKIF